jgi:hypothetical protein
MSATHIKTVMVELDGYATTGSRGGTVVEVIELLRNHETGVDTEGNYAVPSSLQKYVENFEGTDSQRKTLKSNYKMIQLEDDHADVNNVQVGWILDAETGTTLRFAG